MFCNLPGAAIETVLLQYSRWLGFGLSRRYGRLCRADAFWLCSNFGAPLMCSGPRDRYMAGVSRGSLKHLTKSPLLLLLLLLPLLLLPFFSLLPLLIIFRFVLRLPLLLLLSAMVACC